MRIITSVFGYRELPGGARQPKKQLELPSERLPEISAFESGRVDADGTLPLSVGGYKIQ